MSRFLGTALALPASLDLLVIRDPYHVWNFPVGRLLFLVIVLCGSTYADECYYSYPCPTILKKLAEFHHNNHNPMYTEKVFTIPLATIIF